MAEGDAEGGGGKRAREEGAAAAAAPDGAGVAANGQAQAPQAKRVKGGGEEAARGAPPRVRWSSESAQKAALIRLGADGLSARGENGYRMVRASHGAAEGTFFYEVRVEGCGGGEDGHVRLGWATDRAQLEGPVGFDMFGYAYTSKTGARYHRRGMQPFGPAFGSGDVIGALVHLPPQEVSDDVFAFPGRETRVVPGSYVRFYRNGEPLGPAFRDLFGGTYRPAVSLYRSAAVTARFAPPFEFPPPATDEELGHEWRPVSDLAAAEAKEGAEENGKAEVAAAEATTATATAAAAASPPAGATVPASSPAPAPAPPGAATAGAGSDTAAANDGHASGVQEAAAE